MILEHGERYGTLTVIGKPIKANHGIRYRVGCICGFSKQLVKASRFDRGLEKCVRCTKGNG